MPCLQRNGEEQVSVTDLEEYVWEFMPAMKFVAGPRVIARITRAVAARLPSPMLLQASPEGRDRVLDQLSITVQRQQRANYRMGFLLSFVLSALVSEIVRAVWNWWMREGNRERLTRWQQEGVL